MQFIIYAQDHADALHIRQDNRNAHLAWLKSPSQTVTLLTAGPWLDDAGIMRGSLLIVEADNRSDVENWLEGDPYKKAGLTRQATIHPFRWVIGAPDGVKT